MDLNIWAAAEYAIGQPFFFPEGQRVICNGYPGIVAQMYDKGIVEVRLGTGRVCCSATYPDVYPDPLDLVWRMEPPVDRLTLFNRTGRFLKPARPIGAAKPPCVRRSSTPVCAFRPKWTSAPRA
jgi:hypothetical protein